MISKFVYNSLYLDYIHPRYIQFGLSWRRIFILILMIADTDMIIKDDDMNETFNGFLLGNKKYWHQLIPEKKKFVSEQQWVLCFDNINDQSSFITDGYINLNDIMVELQDIDFENIFECDRTIQLFRDLQNPFDFGLF